MAFMRLLRLLTVAACSFAHVVEGNPVKRSVMILGPTRVGKSAIGNQLTKGLKLSGRSDKFPSANSEKSITKELSVIESVVSYWTGDINDGKDKQNMVISVRDTPGMGDTEGASMRILDDIVESIREDPPHGIIFVFDAQSARTLDLEKSLQAFGKCLGVLAEDLLRNAVFINKLSDLEFIADNDGDHIAGLRELEANSELQEDDRTNQVQTLLQIHRFKFMRSQLTMVNEFLGLPEKSRLETVIGNEFNSWSGIELLKKFIARMPDEPIDTRNLRTFTEVVTEAKLTLQRNNDITAAVVREEYELRARLSSLKAKQRQYDGEWSKFMASSFATGAAVGTAYAWEIAMATAYVPGLNLVTIGVATATTTLGTAALLSGAIGAAFCLDEKEKWDLPDRIRVAEADLDAFLRMDQTQRAERVFRYCLGIWEELQNISQLARGQDANLNLLLDYQPSTILP